MYSTTTIFTNDDTHFEHYSHALADGAICPSLRAVVRGGFDEASVTYRLATPKAARRFVDALRAMANDVETQCARSVFRTTVLDYYKEADPEVRALEPYEAAVYLFDKIDVPAGATIEDVAAVIAEAR